MLDRVIALRRPSLLVRAARYGQSNYDRTRHLRRLVGLPATPEPDRALARLLDEERELDLARRAGDAAYSVARHVEIMIALLAEAALMRDHQSQL